MGEGLVSVSPSSHATEKGSGQTIPRPRWEITPAELRRLRIALGRIGRQGGLDDALAALADWALALVDASAILVALRAPDDRLIVHAAAGRGARRLHGLPVEEAADATARAGAPWLRVPIRVDEREVGVVIARPRRAQPLVPDDAELLRLLAVQAALALRQDATARENTELYSRERRRAAQLQAAADLTRRVVRMGRLADLLTFAANALKSRFGYERVRIYLRDDASGELALRGTAGGGRLGRPLDVRSDPVAAWAAASGEPQVVHDRRELGGEHPEQPPGAELAVPIALDGQPIGVLAVAATPPSGLDGGDLALAESIADDLAIAIENLRLTARVRRDAAAAERSRLARELHDETAQQLVAIGRRLELLAQSAAGTAAELAQVQAMVDEALANVRRISRDLRPSLLEELGLVAAIEALIADRVRSGGPDVRFRVVGRARPLPPAVELALYRITQEALGNSLRHAEALTIRVELQFGDDVRLEVADDGRGFASSGDLASLERGGGMGLVGMRDRAAEVGGRLELASRPGRGTTVRAVVPGRGLAAT